MKDECDDDALLFVREQVLGNQHLLSKILSCIAWNEVIRCRAVAIFWREATLTTLVPVLHFKLESVAIRDLREIATYIPNLQSLRYDRHDCFALGDDILTHADGFTNLQHLHFQSANLRSSFPLIRSWTNLKTLNLTRNYFLEWQLLDLSSLQNLERLDVEFNVNLVGNLKDLSVHSKTLVYCELSHCKGVTGNIFDLAKLKHLEWLGVLETMIEGDIRNIGPSDFEALQYLSLSKQMYGGRNLKRITDGPNVMKDLIIHLEKRGVQRIPRVLRLTNDSPDRYDRRNSIIPPFMMRLVTWGKRMGWRWSNGTEGGDCEVTWFDPEPQPGSDGYEAYMKDKECGEPKQENSIFKRFSEPPSEDEYVELCRKRPRRSDSTGMRTRKHTCLIGPSRK
jgi:hypothetical protein